MSDSKFQGRGVESVTPNPSWTPSEAAVEVVARAAWNETEPHVPWEDAPVEERAVYLAEARAGLVAFMGETVTEPCPHLPAGEGWCGFPHCPPLRSLPVVECEAAGLLVKWQVVRVGFRETTPSTGIPT